MTHRDGYHLERYHRRRKAALDYLGGICVMCGTAEDLQIDHIRPELKSFDVAKLWGIAEARFWDEIAKCQILCREHHKDKTRSEQKREVHGTWGQVTNRKCKCDVCNAFVRRYQSDWRARRAAAGVKRKR